MRDGSRRLGDLIEETNRNAERLSRKLERLRDAADRLDDLQDFARVLEDLYNKIKNLNTSQATGKRKNTSQQEVEVTKESDVKQLVADVVKQVVIATHEESSAERIIGNSWIGML